MNWETRIREAAYNSPSGARFTFDYENVRQTVDKKTTAFEFPDVSGTYVQELGHSGRKYPLRMFFWGADYDLEAAAFEAALLESGTGKLEHPMYGVIDVVPFGTIARRDDLKTAANQAVIEVTFWETIDLLYPSSQGDPVSTVLNAISEFNAVSSFQLDSVVDSSTASLRANFKNNYEFIFNTTVIALNEVASLQEDVSDQFDAIKDSITQGIDILLGDLSTLGFQTNLLIQSPARVLIDIQSRFSAYSDLIQSIITGVNAIVTPSLDSKNANKFFNNELYVNAYVTALVISSVNNQFITRASALEAAELIIDQFDQATVWRDDNFQSLGIIDTGESYQKLQESVALCAGFLVEISFSLKQERSIILTRARTIIDLCAELYGVVDERLDFLIATNNLSGSEILELPAGREIVYYV